MKQAPESSKRIIIIGAGPTGLGAAYRLRELGHENWAVYEKEGEIGGLSSSFRDEKGFTWDIGGHVMFSNNERFSNLADCMMDKEFLSHKRECWIRTMESWVPYPFQNNIRYLPREQALECLIGLIAAQSDKGCPSNFENWICKTFGGGIAKLFMTPYNSKVWAVPLCTMSYDWIAERVSVVNVERILKNVIMESDDVGWGPNSTFKFPLHGGTGGFFNRFEPCLRDKISYKKALTGIDIASKTVMFDDGSQDCYDVLINTSPLDLFVRNIRTDKDDIIHLLAKASLLEHNGIYVVGVGLKKKMSGTACWVYCPDENSPFYRVTYFSRYSPNNVPDGDTDTYSSLMCEISFSKYKPLPEDKVADMTVEGLVKTGILSETDTGAITSIWVKKIDYAYPVPTLGRNGCLSEVQPFLESNDIYSRGRFGAWKYEIGNMDHSVLMGIELVDRLLKGAKENIWKL